MRALELYFDEQADGQVRDLWDGLESIDVPSLATRTHGRHRPHVSLTVASGISAGVEESLAEMLADIDGMELRLESIAVFPGDAGVIYLTVVPTTDLLDAHRRVAQHLDERGVDTDEHYTIGRWIPHCTLAQDLSPDQLGRAVRHLAGNAPLTATVRAAGLVEITSGEATPLLG